MQYIDFVSSLNKKQLEAVETDSQYTRVVAGAGSGKTRVLTYRISYLISQENVKPWKILAITFTNKVAAEMKKRVVTIVPDSEKFLTIKTFHSFAAFFLRQEINVLHYPSNFTILDEEDQTKIIKDIVSEKGFRKNDPLVKQAINYIGANKLNEKYPEDITINYERFANEKLCLEIYQEYEEIKSIQFALDFDDLLLKSKQILIKFPQIRAKWLEKFDHILIDEFQDTNNTEYSLVKLLMRNDTCLYVVGDPDQTIYTWRGANQDIILDLDKTFRGLTTIVLEENYRSTQAILDSANKLIAHNKFRVPKNLFTNNKVGDSITVRILDSGMSEAHYVAREIQTLVSDNRYKYSDIVLLYRSNYLTLDFEKALMAKSIPYVIYGGMKFYQRMEIKDVLAYFRLINNIKDDVSFERIINTPRRGIGDRAIQTIRDGARSAHLSLYEYVQSDRAMEECPSKAISALKNLVFRMELTKSKLSVADEMYAKVLEDLITDIGYYEYLKGDEDGENRIDNVKSLFEDIRHYLKNNPESTFDEYLQNIALLSAQDDMQDGEHVTLMTVHTAKGLEYPIVFVVRFNQEVFPNGRALSESGYKALEEERRLAYVAMTRAKERLYLTGCRGFSYVAGGNLVESQFIAESGNTIMQNNGFATGKYKQRGSREPAFFFDDIRTNDDFFGDVPSTKKHEEVKTNGIASWSVGDIVIHKNLGRGVVVEVEDEIILTVNFENHGIKTIMGNHPMVSKGDK